MLHKIVTTIMAKFQSRSVDTHPRIWYIVEVYAHYNPYSPYWQGRQNEKRTSQYGYQLQVTTHPLYIGNCGMHGKYAANMAVMECDLLFSIGTRFNDRITGDLNEFAPRAQIVHIDVDTASISRNVVVDVPVVADAGVALEKLLEWAEKKDTAKWQEQIHRWEKENPLAMRRDRGISPQMIMEHINAQFPPQFLL